MTYWSLCVGATGYGCDGVTKQFQLLQGKITIPITLVKTHPYSSSAYSPHGTLPPNQMVGLFASVGAILHDRCCTTHNDGTFCNSDNTPILSTFDLDLTSAPQYDNNCACLLEWRRAVFDLVKSYGEVMNFPKAPQPKLTQVLSSSRKTSLPGYLGVRPILDLVGGNWTKLDNQGITDTAGTTLIQFSPGTKLLCAAGADPNCKLNPSNDVACAKGVTDSNCKGVLTDAQAQAGDAGYCRNKRFKKLVYNNDGDGYGICA